MKFNIFKWFYDNCCGVEETHCCANCINLKTSQFAFFPEVHGCKEWKRMKEHETVIYESFGVPSTTHGCKYYKKNPKMRGTNIPKLNKI